MDIQTQIIPNQLCKSSCSRHGPYLHTRIGQKQTQVDAYAILYFSNLRWLLFVTSHSQTYAALSSPSTLSLSHIHATKLIKNNYTFFVVSAYK